MRHVVASFALFVVATCSPLAAQADDREIASTIISELTELKDEGKLKGFNLDLQVEEGTVWLKGHVSRPEQEKLAMEVARRTEGVRRVISKVTVKNGRNTLRRRAIPASTPTDTDSEETSTETNQEQEATAEPRALDTETATEVKELPAESAPAAIDEAAESRAIAKRLVAKLKREQDRGKLKGFGIDMEVDHGVLWLKGHVASAEQKYLVLEIARRIQGVTKVLDELTVSEPQENDSTEALSLGDALPQETTEPEHTAQPVAFDTDAERIAQTVIERLQSEQERGHLKGFGVDVNVEEDGTVWLSGYVADEEQQELVLKLAQRVRGVKQVVNDLKIEEPVEPQTLPTDDELVEEEQDEELDEFVGTGTEPQLVPRGEDRRRTRRQQQRIVGYALVRADGSQPLRPINYSQTPMAFAPARTVNFQEDMGGATGPMPMHSGAPGVGMAPARFDHPQLPGYSWPSYAPHPNYGALTYPKQYSAQAWPYIGPFYPYPQVPLGWRSVKLEWKDGWWHLDFKDRYFNNR